MNLIYYKNKLKSIESKEEIEAFSGEFYTKFLKGIMLVQRPLYIDLYNDIENLIENYSAFWDSKDKLYDILKEFEQLLDKIECENKKIFIVHGRDHAMRDAVASFLGKLKQEYEILEDASNSGQTVIEKFTTEAQDCGYAIILMSADDLGRFKTDKEDKPRARQNVILELGYFLAKVGRKNMFILQESGIHLDNPSDFAGIVHVPFDSAGAWKSKLVKELKNSGQYVRDI
ncbi:MAG: nucleotide-binding protein [Bacteroidia bacterium]|nr:nucleotide-binding protein [Bacteroidia bacterium]